MRFAGIFILAISVAGIAMPAGALTFKKGQVLRSDGEIHVGAPFTKLETLIKRADEDGEMVGVSGTNLYVVIDGELTFVPLSDVRSKTKEGMKEVIAAHVLSDAEIGGLAELEGSGFDKLNEGNLAYKIGQIADEAAREAAEAAFQEVIESLEGATIEQIEQATGSTLISTTSCVEGCTEETFY